MIDRIKEIILNRSKAYVFYKNSYEELVETNRKNTLLLRNNRFQIYHKNQEINKLKKQNDKLTYLESENANLNSRIKEYDKIGDMVNSVEIQNKQLNDTIKHLESENNNLNSRMVEYDKIGDMVNSVEIQNKQLNDTIKHLESENADLKSKINEYDNIIEKISNLENQNKQLTDTVAVINKQNEALLKDNEVNLEKIHYLQKQAQYNNIKLDSNYNKYEYLLTNNNAQLLEKIQFNSKQYLMTIIIPVYNTQNYIEKCFLSILNQSIFNKIEIIFVDDCSTDNSLNILIELKNNYDNIKILSTDKNSLFAGRPRNKGLNYVSSDYVLFLDSDDVLIQDACEILLNKIIEHEADMVFGTHLIERDSTQDKEKYELEHVIIPELMKYYEASEELIINNVRDYPFILKEYSVTNKLFNVHFIKENKITFPEYIPAEDSYFLFDAMVNSKKTVFIPNCIYNHNLRRNKDKNPSVSYISNHSTRMGRLKSYNMMYKISKQKNIENIFIENVLYSKIMYMLRLNVFNQKIPFDEYVEIFDEGYPLFKVLLNRNLCPDSYNELFAKIVNRDYEDAMEICKTFN